MDLDSCTKANSDCPEKLALIFRVWLCFGFYVTGHSRKNSSINHCCSAVQTFWEHWDQNSSTCQHHVSTGAVQNAAFWFEETPESLYSCSLHSTGCHIKVSYLQNGGTERASHCYHALWHHPKKSRPRNAPRDFQQNLVLKGQHDLTELKNSNSHYVTTSPKSLEATSAWHHHVSSSMTQGNTLRPYVMSSDARLENLRLRWLHFIVWAVGFNE